MQDLEYPTSLGNGPTKNRSGFQRITSRKKKGQTTMKRQHLRTRADDTICVAQTGSVNGGMCRSSVKGKMSSWNTMFQLLQHANEAAWIRLREPCKSLSKRLWTGEISAILFTNFGVAASEICLKMGVSFLRMMTQLNLRLPRKFCRYVGLFNQHKLVVSRGGWQKTHFSTQSSPFSAIFFFNSF